jgi:hypothetical protein
MCECHENEPASLLSLTKLEIGRKPGRVPKLGARKKLHLFPGSAGPDEMLTFSTTGSERV